MSVPIRYSITWEDEKNRDVPIIRFCVGGRNVGRILAELAETTISTDNTAEFSCCVKILVQEVEE